MSRLIVSDQVSCAERDEPMQVSGMFGNISNLTMESHIFLSHWVPKDIVKCTFQQYSRNWEALLSKSAGYLDSFLQK